MWPAKKPDMGKTHTKLLTGPEIAALNEPALGPFPAGKAKAALTDAVEFAVARAY